MRSSPGTVTSARSAIPPSSGTDQLVAGDLIDVVSDKHTEITFRVSQTWEYTGLGYSQGVRTDQGWEERVLANFMEAGRLKQIPARSKKRRVVLRWLADHFRPAERYPEAQVNDILRRYHDDFALLRRLLVDEEFMHRKGGFYWRAGTLPYPGAIHE